MAPQSQSTPLMATGLVLREAPPTTRTSLGPAPSPATAGSGQWPPATAAETSSCPVRRPAAWDPPLCLLAHAGAVPPAPDGAVPMADSRLPPSATSPLPPPTCPSTAPILLYATSIRSTCCTSGRSDATARMSESGQARMSFDAVGAS